MFIFVQLIQASKYLFESFRRKHEGFHWSRPTPNLMDDTSQEPDLSQRGSKNSEGLTGTDNPQFSPDLTKQLFVDYAEPITLIERPMYASSGGIY